MKLGVNDLIAIFVSSNYLIAKVFNINVLIAVI